MFFKMFVKHLFLERHGVKREKQRYAVTIYAHCTVGSKEFDFFKENLNLRQLPQRHQYTGNITLVKGGVQHQ